MDSLNQLYQNVFREGSETNTSYKTTVSFKLMMEEEKKSSLVTIMVPRGLQERLMLPLGNRGSNNPELWPSQLQGMQGPVLRLSISMTVFFFFFFWENSVIVDLALVLANRPHKHGCGNIGLPEFFSGLDTYTSK